MALLRRLSPTELEVLRVRCTGATTLQIAAHLGIPHADAATHVGNVLDKLGVTYGREGTSLSRMMAFCSLAVRLGASVGGGADYTSPPTQQPSQRAVELTAADDEALLAQRVGGAPPPPTDHDGRRGWIIGGVLAFVLIVGFIALLVFDRDDDEVGAAATPEPATEVVPTTTPTPVEPTEEPEPTPTAIPPTETPEPEPTPTAIPPTVTPVPTPTQALPTPTPAPQPTATASAPEPTPSEGTLAYEADWSTGADEWVLTPGWEREDGALVASGSDVAPLQSPFQPDEPDYAVEVEMIVTGVTGCDEVAGVFVRISEEPSSSGEVPVGYAGNVCADQWRIDVVTADNRDTLTSASHSLDDEVHVYRIEVAGERIRLFIDGEFAGEAFDDRWQEPGNAGIYLDGDLQITVSAFRVFT